MSNLQSVSGYLQNEDSDIRCRRSCSGAGTNAGERCHTRQICRGLSAIHVTAALGTRGAMIEWRRFDLEAQLYSGAVAPKGGRILVPQSPDLGKEPDPGVIGAYLRV